MGLLLIAVIVITILSIELQLRKLNKTNEQILKHIQEGNTNLKDES
ncbi:hypothetical protein [Halobacillus litoralis]|nr:hypothetical protein [Halobacillus litoralis]MYL39656.1 hypothetical protein [Halobacillus litoralis]